MFDSLNKKLERVFKNIRGQGKLTEKNMKDSLQEIRVALLEADVNYKVVKQFIADVQEHKAIGNPHMRHAPTRFRSAITSSAAAIPPREKLRLIASL